MTRPTWAQINLDYLADNFRLIKNFVGEAVEVMAVVKADAYGHGAVSCARRLAAEGADWFAVALPEEAFELRQNDIETPILALGGFWRGQESRCLRERVTPVICRIDQAESFERAAREQNRIADVHVKIDTGMGRLGVRFDDVVEFAEKLKEFENLRVDGLMTHFAAADEPAENDFTSEQIGKFERAIEIFHEKGFRPAWRDLANSPGLLAHPASRSNLIRPGGVLYGIGKDIFPTSVTVESLRPVMSLRSQINLLKRVPKGETLGYARSFRVSQDSLIATVPIGYADGLPRALSNRGKAIVNGVFAPLVGRVSMDLILLDVTTVPNVRLFDEVCLFGEKDDLQISVEDVAAQADTISYEITCGVGKRVPRRAEPRI